MEAGCGIVSMSVPQDVAMSGEEERGRTKSQVKTEQGKPRNWGEKQPIHTRHSTNHVGHTQGSPHPCTNKCRKLRKIKNKGETLNTARGKTTPGQASGDLDPVRECGKRVGTEDPPRVSAPSKRGGEVCERSPAPRTWLPRDGAPAELVCRLQTRTARNGDHVASHCRAVRTETTADLGKRASTCRLLFPFP